MTLNRCWAFLGVGLWSKIFFRSTHVAKQHMFSLSPSILAFNFIQFKGNFFLAFGGKEIDYFEGWSQAQIVLGSTNIVQQLPFYKFCFIVSKDLFRVVGQVGAW